MGTGPKNEWGGRRPNAGRKRSYSITDQQALKMLRTAKRWAKERKETLDDILMKIAYFETDSRVRVAAIKVFKEFTMSKQSEQNVKVTDERPRILLPERRPDPALAIPERVGEA